jgi:hypothetical protein
MQLSGAKPLDRARESVTSGKGEVTQNGSLMAYGSLCLFWYADSGVVGNW